MIHKPLYLVHEDISNIFRELWDYHTNEVSVFVDRRERYVRKDLNIFTLAANSLPHFFMKLILISSSMIDYSFDIMMKKEQ